MRAASRHLTPATAYAKQIPLVRMENLILQENAGLEDTLRELPGLIRKNLPQTRAIAQRLKGRNLKETCRNIYEFIYRDVGYKEDHEEPLRPRRHHRNSNGNTTKKKHRQNDGAFLQPGTIFRN